MNKQDFLDTLRDRLSAALPQEEVADSVEFYSEMINDRMEEGLSEEDAVLGVGSVEQAVSQILSNAPTSKPIQKPPARRHRFKAWEILLLVLGAPIWLSLLVAIAAIILSLYVSAWAVILSLWAVYGAFAGCAVGGVFLAVLYMIQGELLSGIAMLGCGLVCGGISILLFFGCKQVTKGLIYLTKQCGIWIKSRFRKGGNKDE